MTAAVSVYRRRQELRMDRALTLPACRLTLGHVAVLRALLTMCSLPINPPGSVALRLRKVRVPSIDTTQAIDKCRRINSLRRKLQQLL